MCVEKQMKHKNTSFYYAVLHTYFIEADSILYSSSSE